MCDPYRGAALTETAGAAVGGLTPVSDPEPFFRDADELAAQVAAAVAPATSVAHGGVASTK